ncbi:hyccin isoform X1 [Brachionus plicatilis]|uniref:Hyccin isoform X1 n=1 Tax=Brachionus plicatilis TaxID=10195 RepID=A0A3M7PN60_BRAPC|nr:hyccin isoform X1 [Brachionus plicatilis]
MKHALNVDIEWLAQNSEQFFDAAANLLKSKDEKNIGKVCMKLANLYKEKDWRSKLLIFNCIPVLLNQYFMHFYDEKLCSLFEVCILTIYNLSLSDENVKLNRIKIPNLSLPSVYHSPQVASIHSELTESSLSKLESEYIILEEQFKPYLDTINSEKRYNLIRFLLLLYYSRLSSISRLSKVFFCEMCLKICKINRGSLKNQPIYLTSKILIEMIRILFFLFNNQLELDAYIAIESISDKAEEDLMIDVIVMCNSIKNLIQQSKMETSLKGSISNGKVSRSSSMHSERRKSAEKLSPLKTNELSPKKIVSNRNQEEKKNDHENIPIIDETSGENDDNSESTFNSDRLTERL